MNVDRIDVRLLPRRPYEAQDLGLQLLRRNAAPTFAAVALVSVPVWVALLLLDLPSPGISLAVVWWLKPLMDRVALHVLSRGVFGQAPSPWQTLASLPKLLDRPLVAALTWRRLQLRRSLWMPIACLEGLRGKALAERRRVLESDGGSGAATLATVVFLHLEGGLAFALYFLVASFLPEGFLPPFGDPFAHEEMEPSLAYDWTSTLTWLPALFLVETMYVAAGFGLYLSRRTQLEGWDIELAFGRLGTRLREAAQRGIAVALPLLLGAASLLASTDLAPAQEPQDPQAVAREVLEHPDFETTRTQTQFASSFDGEAVGLGPLIAPVVQALAWIALIVLVVALVVHLARRVEAPRARATVERAPPPTEAFGLDLRPESLPDDIASAAAALARRGDLVGALSLLYRGALARLVEHDQLQIGPGDTEHDCIRRVRAAAADGADPRPSYFADLTQCWLRAAWGASPPTEHAALALCEGWGSHFGVRR